MLYCSGNCSTGRVDYFPMSEYLGVVPDTGRHRIRRHRQSAHRDAATACRRTVDAAGAVLSCTRRRLRRSKRTAQTRHPGSLRGRRCRFKTGMDVCLWLLRNDVCPDKLTWIMPRVIPG